MATKPRNILITGAGSGIGAATARAFAASGDRVHLFDISQERLDAVSVDLDLVTMHLVDVADARQVRAAIEGIDRQFGSIDVLVSNAGIFDGLAGIQETTYELWDRIIAVNLTGAFNVIKPVSEVMIRQKSGRIITISSIAATRTSPDGLSYDASKAGLEGMTRRLAVDLGAYGITANTVAPGVISTSILPRRASSSATWRRALRWSTTKSRTRSSLRWSFLPAVAASPPRSPRPSISWPVRVRPTSTAKSSMSMAAGSPTSAVRISRDNLCRQLPPPLAQAWRKPGGPGVSDLLATAPK